MKFNHARCLFSRRLLVVIGLAIAPAVSAQSDSLIWKYRLSGEGMVVTGNVERFLLSLRGSYSVTSDRLESVLTPSYVFGEQNRKAAERDLMISLYNRLYPNRKLYGFALAIYDFNKPRRIDARWQTGIGLGLNVLRGQQHTFSITAGAIYEKTWFSSLQKRDTWRFSSRFKGSHQVLQRQLRFNHETFIQPSLSQSDDFRWRTLATLELPLVDRLALRSTVENSYESIVLAGRKKNDFRWTFGVSFGN
jgi:hypothetical protein